MDLFNDFLKKIYDYNNTFEINVGTSAETVH